MGKHYGEQIISEVLKLRTEGKTYKAIGEKFGLKKEQVRELIKRHRRKEEKKLLGVEIRPKGRPRTRNLTKQQQLELEKKRLKRENDLLRSFLQAAGRM
ncbi:MAG: transposase [Clostridiales bacterium]|nr:transposase [Clostridiales bacterium]